MTTTISYVEGAELAPARLRLIDVDDAPADLSASTITVKVGHLGTTAVLTKTSGFAAPTPPFAAGAPNLTVNWSAGELDAVDPGVYWMQITARSAGLDRIWQTLFRITRAIT
jgi:hypothetical protein